MKIIRSEAVRDDMYSLRLHEEAQLADNPYMFVIRVIGGWGYMGHKDGKCYPVSFFVPEVVRPPISSGSPGNY